jgi:ribose 5-phosphate isomerase
MAAQVQAAVSQDELKKQAAWKAVDYVKSGMVVGLGTGACVPECRRRRRGARRRRLWLAWACT